MPTTIPRRLTAVIALCAALWLGGGCEAPGRRAPLDPLERADLRRRALDLLLRATQSDLDVVAAHAMEALVAVAPQDGRPSFRQALRSESPLVRFAAAVSLGRVGDCTQRETLARLAQRDPDERVRLAAAYAALRCGGDDDAYGPILVAALEDSPDENLRADAAYLIGLLGERRAIPRLQLLIRRDSSTKVAVHAVAALAMLGEEDAVDDLIAYTQGDRVARFIALQTLVELESEEAFEAFRDRLSPREDFVLLRLIAARGLGTLGSAEGYDYAARMADDRTEGPPDFTERMKIRVNAALALGAIGQERALPLLRRLAEIDDDPRIQVAACYAILQILPPSGALR